MFEAVSQQILNEHFDDRTVIRILSIGLTYEHNSDLLANTCLDYIKKNIGKLRSHADFRKWWKDADVDVDMLVRVVEELNV